MHLGIARKGGATPSSHTSTGAVFFFWSVKLWGLRGSLGAGVLVLGLALGGIYGRYHYASGIVAGVLLGLLALWASGFWA